MYTTQTYAEVGTIENLNELPSTGMRMPQVVILALGWALFAAFCALVTGSFQ